VDQRGLAGITFSGILSQEERAAITRKVVAAKQTNFEGLEHIVRAAKDQGETEFIAIGSQSLLISLPDLLRELRRSPELDITGRRNLLVADLIDGNLSEITAFHTTFQIYPHGVFAEYIPAGLN
jgi:hypothetical protein